LKLDLVKQQVLVWIVAFLALTGAALALFAARPLLGEAHVALIFLLVVLGSSAAGGRVLGIPAAV